MSTVNHTKQPKVQPRKVMDHPFKNNLPSPNHQAFQATKPFERTAPANMQQFKNNDYQLFEATNKNHIPNKQFTSNVKNIKLQPNKEDFKSEYKKYNEPSQKKNGSECIGFSTLPDQLHKRAVKRGFDFSFMVVGESGLGKTTFLQRLFSNLDDHNETKEPRTVKIEQRYMEVEERGVKLRLTVIDTPGFGSSINSKNDVKVVENHLTEQLGSYMKAEMGTRRQTMQDHRVHCCLYFINPSCRSLKEIDLLAMKKLQDKVNLVPIIAKADTLTINELKNLKNTIRKEVEEKQLRIYQLPDIDDDDDDEYISRDKELKEAYPFSLICGNKIVDIGGKKVMGRVYPWGIVEVENKKHSDFNLLRYFLLNSHMHDLIETTKEVHYENYRSFHLKEIQRNALNKNEEQLDTLLKEKEKELLEMQRKLEEVRIQMSTQNLNDESKVKHMKDQTNISKSSQNINEKMSPTLTLMKNDAYNQQMGDGVHKVNQSHPNIFSNKEKLHFGNTKRK